MTASLVPPVVHGWRGDTEPDTDHLALCATWNSNVCTCHHTELRMTPGYRPAKPVQLPCDEEP